MDFCPYYYDLLIIMELPIFDPETYLIQSTKPSQISVNVKLAICGFVGHCTYKAVINLIRAVKQPTPPHYYIHQYTHSHMRTVK